MNDARADAELAAGAGAIGERRGDAELVATAGHLQGACARPQGQTAKGLALLDEATLAVTTKEMPPDRCRPDPIGA